MKNKLVVNFKISQLKVPVIIGVYPQERKNPQNVFIDLEFSLDERLVVSRDDLSDTIDYAALCRQLIAALQKTKFQLIETLAEYIANYCLSNFAIEKIIVSLTKKPYDLPQVIDGVTVQIEKSSLVNNE